MKLAFLGTGLMGSPMVCRLLKEQHEVTVWNRSAEKARALAAHGARVADSSIDAVRGAQAVITMLINGEAVESVLMPDALLETISPGAMVIDMSSIAPTQAKEHAVRLRKRGIRYLDAPVSGGTLGAESGTLAIMAGGDEIDVQWASPILSAMGHVTHVGPSGSGQLVKLANQMIVGMTIGAVAEALLLVERGGGSSIKAIEAMQGGFASSRILEVHGTRMAQRDFKKRAAMRVQLKDMNNALTTAESLDLPITSLVADMYLSAISHGNGDLDHSALWLELERRNR